MAEFAANYLVARDSSGKKKPRQRFSSQECQADLEDDQEKEIVEMKNLQPFEPRELNSSIHLRELRAQLEKEQASRKCNLFTQTGALTMIFLTTYIIAL